MLESIKNSSASDNSFAGKSISYAISKIKFNDNCLKQKSGSFLHKNVVNWYIAYELDI